MENKTDDFENRIALGMKSHLGWKELTFRGLGILSRRLANHLIKIGINKGDKVAILSESMPEWGATLFASVLAGATVVPLDIKLTIYELQSILADCQPKLLLVSNAFLETAVELKKEIPSIEDIIVLDGSSAMTEYASMYNIENNTEGKWRHRAPNKTALIIYTSGTTGSPKGVEISFKNVLAQIDSISKCFDFGENDQLLSILPMNHLFELTVGFLSFLNWGTSIYYSKSLKPKDLFSIIRDKKVTFMIVVPAFLKLLKTGIETEVNQLSPVRKAMFKFFYSIADYLPLWTRKLLFKKIHDKFGGKFKGCIAGGAPLDLDVGIFFKRIGMLVYQGYGLSEASPVVATERASVSKFRSVGRALPNVKVKTDPETGELLVKGDNVMKGYYNQPELTKEVFTEDGWLKTGDIAKIDKEGFVFITGRIKSMIVLSGGKKVFPEEVESVLEKSPMFEEVCVFGGRRTGGQKNSTEDVCVAILPKQEIAESAQNEQELENIIKAEVKKLSQRLAAYKRPVNIITADAPMPRTATRKIKRNEVKKLLLG
ncbi:MAG: AMP-binding protein [Candidatus Gastranaerophilales bacterium]|nr:AMP-binding protein [Candidatus Gastranaerophilales bacterium]